MEADLRQGQSLQQGMEVPLDQVLAAQRPADMVREDQVVVLPQVAGVQPFRVLSKPLPLDRGDPHR
jgi:hypothetical protein